MKRAEPMEGWTLLLTLSGASGIAVFFAGYAFPVYTDQARATRLKLEACNKDGMIPGWYEQLHALETLRHPLMQSGLSLLLAAVTLFALRQLFSGVRRKGLRTPAKRATFFLLGIGVLGLSWFSQVASFGIDQNRGEFPWCADTIAIPIYGLTIGYMVLTALCILVGGILATLLHDLPRNLLAWRPERMIASLAISFPFAALGLVIAFIGILTAPTSAFLGTPAAVVALYLVEATRSGLIARLAPAIQAA